VIDRLDLSQRERRVLSAALYLLPIVLSLVVVALVRDMWPPFRQMAIMFFLGWLLAFLLDPIVTWLVNHFPWLPRGPAAALTFIVVAGITIVATGLVALSFADSIAEFIERGPAIVEELTEDLGTFQAWAESLGIPVDAPELVDALVASLRTELDDILANALGGSLTIVTLGTTIIFIAVVMVGSKASFLTFSRRLVPSDSLPLMDALTFAIARSFGGYIRGQFGLAIVYGVFVALIGLAFGVPFLPFIAVTTALLQTIPFFGQLVSWIPLVLVTFVFVPAQILPVVVIMAVGWLIMQNIVSPRVMGSAVGLNPLVVLAAVFLGGAIAGPLGAVFGVPILAAIVTVFVAWLDHIHPEDALPPPSEAIDLSPRPAEIEQGHSEPDMMPQARVERTGSPP
jgi:predicted PurR-regulated permease PerM